MKDRYRKIGRYKRSIPISVMQWLSRRVRTIYEKCSLQFEDKPDYQMLKLLFIKLFKKEKFRDSGRYDWDN